MYLNPKEEVLQYVFLPIIIRSVICFVKIFKNRKEHPLRGLEKKYKIDEIKDLLERYNFTLIDLKKYSLGMIGIISAEIKTQ